MREDTASRAFRTFTARNALEVVVAVSAARWPRLRFHFGQRLFGASSTILECRVYIILLYIKFIMNNIYLGTVHSRVGRESLPLESTLPVFQPTKSPFQLAFYLGS